MKPAVIVFFIIIGCTSGDTLENRRRNIRWVTDNYPAKLSEFISFNEYNTYEQILNYVSQLALTYPDIVEASFIGNSVEGRPIPVIRITSNVRTAGLTKPVVLFDAGIHAREWIAPAVALYLMYELVENHNKYKHILDNLDVRIIPLLNPDGYIYSMTEDRMWRKNRAPTTDPQCMGVDLNRNFDLYFGGLGTSRDPCDETYIGKGPFSEPETQALRKYALGLKPKLFMYFTLHSYGKFILYPWGFGEVLPKDWKDLDRLARTAEKALSTVRGTRYAVGSSTHLLGAAAGGSDDWMKAKAGVKYSYTVELPGGGDEGFDLPPESIYGCAKEMFMGLKAGMELAIADRIENTGNAFSRRVKTRRGR